MQLVLAGQPRERWVSGFGVAGREERMGCAGNEMLVADGVNPEPEHFPRVAVAQNYFLEGIVEEVVS